MTLREPVRPIPRATLDSIDSNPTIMGDELLCPAQEVDAAIAAHDKLVGELRERVAALESAIANALLDCGECDGFGTFKSKVDGHENKCEACAPLRRAVENTP